MISEDKNLSDLRFKVNIGDSELSEEEVSKVAYLLRRYQDCVNDDDLGYTDTIKHKIILCMISRQSCHTDEFPHIRWVKFVSTLKSCCDKMISVKVPARMLLRLFSSERKITVFDYASTIDN